MALFNPRELFEKIENKNMAIGAFNVHNMEYTQAVIRAAEAENAPVILMLGEPILKYANLDSLANIALFEAERASVDIAIIIDHAKDMANINRCIELGISVMADGSHLPFEENIEFTRAVVELAKKKGLSVEGELGSLAGVEDAEEVLEENMTDPRLADEFVDRTGIDCLAVAIGNRHGIYNTPPKIDIERLIKIKANISKPVVLHGGSDLPLEVSRKVIETGIKKFNVGTDLKYAMSRKLKEILNSEPMPFQPQETFGIAREAVILVAREKIRLFKNGNEY